MHFQEQSYKTVEISDGDLLLLENHPLIFDEYSYAKEFYRPIKNKRVKVLDSVRYSELQKKEKNVLDDDIILYLVSDSKKQNIDSIHINLIDSNIFLNLNIDQVKNIALSYLPNNFFEIYSNDASYQFSSDGVTTYTASYRLNQNGIDYHNNVDSNISPYYYFRLIHFTATNKWQIKTGISAYGGKELEWINNYATPWNIE